jgi:ferric-dicitrate binding protein FerR (iron transport regulator)
VTENQRYLQELLRLIREDIGTPEILAQLHNLLARDRAVLQDYIREMHLQASLNWLLDGQVPGGTAVRAEVRRQLWARRRCWVWRGVGSLVAVCLLATLGFVAASRWMGGEEDDALVVGRIRAAKTPDWAGEAQGDEGARIRVGQEFDLLRGLVELEFRNGARVTLEGPAICRIESSNRVLLTGGRLLADVPPAAVGFTVDTPSARVVDLGTRFGVVVGSDGSPEIHVLAGSVRVESERLPPERLEVDQASRYSPDGETRRSIPLALIPFRPCLTLSAGIAELTGQARFAAEPSETVDESGPASSIRWHRPNVLLFRQAPESTLICCIWNRSAGVWPAAN